jgi:hypothetical protein
VRHGVFSDEFFIFFNTICVNLENQFEYQLTNAISHLEN